MITQMDCDEAGRLNQSGLLSWEQTEALAQHAEQCLPCAEAMESSWRDDPLALVGDPTTPLVSPPFAPDELIERLKGLARLPIHGPSRFGDPTPPPQEQTEPGQVTQRRSPDSVVDGMTEVRDDDFSFLAPSQAEGEMGRLGPYRVLSVLGSGGMGIVLRAEDLALQRPVALKVVRPRVASPAASERFLREARLAASLKNDHIVTIHQVSEEKGVPFLAMELLEGESLEARLQREGKLPLGEVVRVGRDAALGLASAHKKGLIHRDVKPANVWLEASEDGMPPRVKLLDFGLAREASQPGLTQVSCIVGTPGYMAPEQARGDAVDGRSDLFSLGCLLYKATVGRAAFDSNDPVSALIAVTLRDPVPPRQIDPTIPQALNDLIVRLLAKEPANRPVSASAVAEALAAMLDTAPTVVLSPRRPRRRPLALAALLMLGVLGVVMAGVILVPTSEGQFTVEVADDEVAVAINKQGGLKLRDSKTGKEYRVLARQSKSLPSGKYELVVTEKDSDFKFTGEVFEIKPKDKAARVSVSFTPKVIEERNKAAKRDLPLERKVADWVLREKGWVKVSGSIGRISSASDLPEKVWYLTEVGLEQLNTVTDDSLKNLAGVGELDSLNLNQTKVTDAGLALLVAQGTQVRELALSRTAVTNDGMKHVAKMKGLEGLMLSRMPKVTEEGLVHLAGLKSLQRLEMLATTFTEERFAKLAALENLRELNLLGSRRITAKGLKHLSGLKHLQRLNLNDTRVGDDALAAIAGLTSLTNLHLQRARISDESLKHLAGMKKMTWLTLGHTEVTGVGLSQFPELTKLYMTGTPLSEQGLMEISELKELNHLVLDNAGMTDERLKYLAGLKKLQKLGMPANDGITDEGLVHLSDLRNLVLLVLSNTKVTDNGVEKLQKLRPTLTIRR